MGRRNLLALKNANPSPWETYMGVPAHQSYILDLVSKQLRENINERKLNKKIKKIEK